MINEKIVALLSFLHDAKRQWKQKPKDKVGTSKKTMTKYVYFLNPMSKPKNGHTILRYTAWSNINEQQQNSYDTKPLELSLYHSEFIGIF